MKKLTAILLALVLVLGMSSALAADKEGATGIDETGNTCTITIYLPDARTAEDEMVEWSYPESIELDFIPAADEESYDTLIPRGNPMLVVTDYMILPTSKIKLSIGRNNEETGATAWFDTRPKGVGDDSTDSFKFNINIGSVIEIDKDTVDSEENLTRTFLGTNIQNSAWAYTAPKKGTGHIIGEGPQFETKADLTFHFYCEIIHPDA